MEQYQKDKKKLSRALGQKRVNTEATKEIDDQAAAEQKVEKESSSSAGQRSLP